MAFNPDIHHRHSIRLREYDYSSGGAYFVTICAYQRECLFGEVVAGEMRLSDCGQIVREEWENTAIFRDNVELDVYAVMPNHFHGIILITIDVGARRAVPDLVSCAPEQGTARRAPTLESFGAPVPGSLATILRSFKSAATKRINALRDNPGCPVWQRNYFEHVIRNEDDLANIRQYIADNPMKWDMDENNPANARML
jgi:putative transposase